MFKILSLLALVVSLGLIGGLVKRNLISTPRSLEESGKMMESAITDPLREEKENLKVQGERFKSKIIDGAISMLPAQSHPELDAAKEP